MDILYPELEDYIYQYCGKFMTEDEVMAKKTVMYSLNTESDDMISMMVKKGWISDDPKILTMIEDGSVALKDRIVKRIWNDHREELSLNLCPVCKLITRTPDARQCRFCFHNWH